ncbi:MAG: DUF5119 domain-containing protein [Alistipes sp.]|nr:DUF5119 domain-containing protein [Alistipes sp.]
MKRIFTYVLSGALLFALAAEVGCTKQSLDNRKNEGFVEVALTWSGETPSGARIHFYPVSDAESAVPDGVDESVPEYRVVDCSASGWSGKLPVGTYRVIAYNTDAGNVDIRNEQDYEQAEIYVLPESAAATASRAGECIAQPGNLMLTSKLEEGQLVVPFNDHVKVTAKPEPRVKSVELSFKVEGDVELVSGMLTGVSQALSCSDFKCHPDPCSVNFSVQPYSGEGDFNYEAKISVLDLVAPKASATHTVVLNLVANGTPYQISVDVTDLVNQFLQENGGNIPVEIPVPIPVRLEMIGNIPSVEVLPWDNTGSGSGSIGNAAGSGSADVL